jgi:dolichyl-diphosphooligosaccharide--protein glycosyltransferase
MAWSLEGESDDAAGRRWAIIATVAAIVVFALFLRTYWNAGAAVSGGEFELSGNDPYYHKRAIDYIQNNGWTTLLEDPMLNYPMGATNPNPPLFEWSVAVGGAALSPLFGGDIATSTWWVFEWSPAIWGALAIVPTFLIGRHLFGNKSGIVAAFILATATSHIERSALGFSDHDAPVLFLILLSFYFYLKAVDAFDGRTHWVDDWTSLPSIESGLTDFWGEHRKAVGYGVLAGMGVASVAQMWKGFPYALGIMFLYSALNMLTDHWGNRDSTGVFVVTAIALFVGVIVPFPFYAVSGLTSFLRSSFFIVLAEFVMGLVLVPTRDLPFVLVLPIFVLGGAIGVAAAFLVVPGVAQSLLYSLVYFRGTTLYSTIAEAQPADINAAAFSIGPIAYLLAMTALFYLAWKVWREPREGRLFMFTWAVTAIFMAHSAVRFMFNATPAMALLGGWMTAITLDALRLREIPETFHQLGGSFLRGLRRAVQWWQAVGIVAIALFLVVPNVILAVDAGMPSSVEQDYQREWLVGELKDMGVSEQRIQSQSLQGLYQLYIEQRLEEENLESTPENRQDVQEGLAFFIQKRFGAFGQNFLPGYWNDGLEWLRGQNQDIEDPADRPAFLSWWDYGHWNIYIAKHPSVADNFQNGYTFAGNFITSENETVALQLFAARYQPLFERSQFEGHLENVGVSPENASATYDALDDFEYSPHLSKEQSVELITNLEDATCDLESTNERCKKTRYFAADVRLMPFDRPNTPRVEQPSIFYAPVTLAGKTPEDFTQVLVTGNQQNPFPDSPRQGTEYYNQSEVDRMVAQQQGQQQQPGGGFQPQGQELRYKQPFFDSMFYKTYVGRPPRAIFSPQTQEVDGSALRQPLALPQPGFNLDHFRLVYMNNQLRMIKFYQGAQLNGTVENSDGEPISSAQITVYDDAGEEIIDYTDRRIRSRIGPSDLNVPHNSGRTNETGAFNVTSTFSTGGDEVTLVFQRRIFQPGRRPTQIELGRAQVEVTPQEAEEGVLLTPEDRPALDIRLKPATVEGTIYDDRNDNDTYEPGVDAARGGFDISIGGHNGTADAEGNYTVDDVPAGSQPVQIDDDAWRPTRSTRFVEVTANETAFHNVSITPAESPVEGRAWYDANGDGQQGPAENVTRQTRINFTAQNETAQDASVRVGDDGNYTTRLKPGEYTISGAFQADGRTWTLDENVTVPMGTDRISLDLEFT